MSMLSHDAVRRPGSRLKSGVCVALISLLSGCAAFVPQGEKVAPVLLHDSLFAAPQKPVRAADVFAVSDDMRRYLREEIGSAIEAKGKERGLYEALYSRNQLRLEYDAEM